MADLLKDWVRDIFIVVTALGFAEIVLPQGSMKKYLKFVFSIIVLGVVLSPMSQLQEFDFFDEDFTKEFKTQETIANNTEDLEKIQALQLDRIYQEKIKDEAKAAISEYYPDLIIYNIQVVFHRDEDKRGFSGVKQIIIEGGECSQTGNIISIVSQRLGIEEEKLSYILPEENEK